MVANAAATPVRWLGASHFAWALFDAVPKERIGGSADRAAGVRAMYVEGKYDVKIVLHHEHISLCPS